MSRANQRSEADGTFWVSYSDLATALLLVFVLILVVKSRDAQHRAQQASDRQEELIALRQKVSELLTRRESVADRLNEAVEQANGDLGESVFRFVDQRVEVSDQDVAWFHYRSAELTDAGKQQLAIFFAHLYDQLLREGDTVIRPEFLESIDVLGHTDPTWRTDPDWTWESYERNLALSQSRALSVVRHIRRMYDEGHHAERPWQPFVALLNASGRSWTRTYCDTESQTMPLDADAFLRSTTDPCEARRIPSVREDADGRSRRVSFGFRLDDRAILEDLQTRLEAAGGAS